MDQNGRERASELDLTRMIVRPQAPSAAVWWPVVTLVAMAVVIVPSLMIFKMGVAPEPSHKAPVAQVSVPQVSRTTTFLLDLPRPVPALSGPPISVQLRQPIRITDRSAKRHDLRWLVARALDRFDHVAADQDVLQTTLVRVLAEGRSDTYVDAALNAALARGEFAVPIALATPLGEIDTPRLLLAVLEEAQG